MPSQNGVGREQRANLCKLFAAENLAFDGQATSLVIGQQGSFLAAFLFENCVLDAKVLNDFLLLSIDQTGKNDQHQLPGSQNELHRRTKSPSYLSIAIGH
jgi:hypothetical protein